MHPTAEEGGEEKVRRNAQAIHPQAPARSPTDRNYGTTFMVGSSGSGKLDGDRDEITYRCPGKMEGFDAYLMRYLNAACWRASSARWRKKRWTVVAAPIEKMSVQISSGSFGPNWLYFMSACKGGETSVR